MKIPLVWIVYWMLSLLSLALAYGDNIEVNDCIKINRPEVLANCSKEYESISCCILEMIAPKKGKTCVPIIKEYLNSENKNTSTNIKFPGNMTLIGNLECGLNEIRVKWLINIIFFILIILSFYSSSC